MGGSFNPIHLGHLLLAETARENFSLSQVIFMPTGNPGYHVKEMPISSEHRFVMTSLAVASNSNFIVSRMELDRVQPSFTIDTIVELRNIYPIETVDLFFITGADSILDILSWKMPAEILKLTSFIAGTRPSYDLGDFEEKVNQLGQAREKIHLMQMPMLDISSSQIRRNIREGKSIRYLVVESVFCYIEKNKCYV